MYRVRVLCIDAATDPYLWLTMISFLPSVCVVALTRGLLMLTVTKCVCVCIYA